MRSRHLFLGRQMPANRKPWWKSRVLWVNGAVAALAAAEASTGFLQPLLPVNVYAAIAFVLPIINALLRVTTTQGIGLRETS